MSDPELEKIIERRLREFSGRKGVVRMGAPVALTKGNFDKIINGDLPVLVDFWAEWCSPCRMMHPIFERLSSKYCDKMVFARLNVDDNGDIASHYKIFSIPTFLVFAKGKPIDSAIGAVGEKVLEKLIAKHAKG